MRWISLVQGKGNKDKTLLIQAGRTEIAIHVDQPKCESRVLALPIRTERVSNFRADGVGSGQRLVGRREDDCFHRPESAAARSLLSSASMSCTLPESAVLEGEEDEQGAEPRGEWLTMQPWRKHPCQKMGCYSGNDFDSQLKRHQGIHEKR